MSVREELAVYLPFVLLLLLLATLCTLIYYFELLFLYPSNCCYNNYNFSDVVCLCVCVCPRKSWTSKQLKGSHLTEQVHVKVISIRTKCKCTCNCTE